MVTGELAGAVVVTTGCVTKLVLTTGITVVDSCAAQLWTEDAQLVTVTTTVCEVETRTVLTVSIITVDGTIFVDVTVV